MAKKKTKKQAVKAIAKKTKKYQSDKVTEVAPQPLVDLTVLAKWACSLKNIDHFEFDWEYRTAAGVWLQGGTKNVPPTDYAAGYYQTTFDAPSDDTVSKVRYRTKAVAKTHEVTETYYVKEKVTSGKDKGKIKVVKKTLTKTVSYWTAQWTSWQETTAPAASQAAAARVAPPATPSAPSASRNSNGTVTVSWNAQAAPATHVWLCRVQDGAWDPSQRVDVAGWIAASATEYVDSSASAGHAYRYFLAAYNSNGDRWSGYSELSDAVEMQPEAPRSLKASAVSPTSVRLEWKDSGYTGDGYKVEYTTNARAWELNATGDIETDEIDGTPTGGGYAYTVTNLDPGNVWYFRVIRTEGSLDSQRSDMASAVIGTVPTAPTLAGTLSAYIKGESVTMAWTHNCEDGSEQTKRHILVKKRAADETAFSELVNSTSSTNVQTYTLDTSNLSDGTEITWAVRTKGLLDGANDWSPWSETLSFKVWVKPELTVSVTQASSGDPVSTEDPLTALPMDITLRTGSNATSQQAIEWSWSIVADEAFTYVGDDGEDEFMAAGTETASGYIDANESDFDGSEQTVRIGAADATFMHGIPYTVKAVALMDSGLMTDEATATFSCAWDDDIPEPSASVDLADDYSARVYPACYSDDQGTLQQGVLLSVYRIDPDGTLVELASGLPNSGTVAVCDPHPSFGSCWYRVCANSTATDLVTVHDERVDVPYGFILIQWDERTIYSAGVTEMGMASFKSVELPYDIEMTEKYAPDVALAEYVGREHPVSYYGTQKGQSASWKVSVARDEADVAALRELAAWPDDCYVREPSGTGYWAHVEVSGITQSASSGIAGISIEVTRVEGEEEAVVA